MEDLTIKHKGYIETIEEYIKVLEEDNTIELTKIELDKVKERFEESLEIKLKELVLKYDNKIEKGEMTIKRLENELKNYDKETIKISDNSKKIERKFIYVILGMVVFLGIGLYMVNDFKNYMDTTKNLFLNDYLSELEEVKKGNRNLYVKYNDKCYIDKRVKDNLESYVKGGYNKTEIKEKRIFISKNGEEVLEVGFCD